MQKECVFLPIMLNIFTDILANAVSSGKKEKKEKQILERRRKL